MVDQPLTVHPIQVVVQEEKIMIQLVKAVQVL
jgi:hypothetical protein